VGTKTVPVIGLADRITQGLITILPGAFRRFKIFHTLLLRVQGMAVRLSAASLKACSLESADFRRSFTAPVGVAEAGPPMEEFAASSNRGAGGVKCGIKK
jgi:hypothetical protein